MADFTSKKNQSFFLILISLGGYLATYLFNAFLTNHLTPHHYGSLAAAIALLTILGTSSLIGIDTSSKKYLARYIQEDNRFYSTQFLRWTQKILIKNSFLIIIIDLFIVVLIYCTEKIFNIHLPRAFVSLFFILFAPFQASIILLSAYFSSIEFNIAATFIENTALNVILLIIAIIFIISPVQTFNIKSTFVIYALSYSLLLLVTTYYCYSLYKKKEY